MEQRTGSKLGQQYDKAVLSPCLFNSYGGYPIWNAGLDESKLESTLPGDVNLRYADDTTLRAESEEELKSLLMRVKEESEKAGLKLKDQKVKIMASGPTHHLLPNRKEKSTSRDRFYFPGPQNPVDIDCRHEIKRCLLLGKKAMTNLDSVLKSKDITLLTNVCIVKAMVFPVVMYRCECHTYQHVCVFFKPLVI